MFKEQKALDMTRGPIAGLLVRFAVPLLIGNVFQMLYNTVDALIVGNFVGKEALAAVGSTSSIVNMLVMFFNGVSIGAGVIISQHYGAKDDGRLHRSIETTMALTGITAVLFTGIGIAGAPFMLRLMATPDDVLPEAICYLKIYFAGLSGLLIYNMGSGILRAVGDTKRPLYFLLLSSVMNVILDLLFVVIWHMGIAGVGLATVLSQMVSAALILWMLIKSKENYRYVLKDTAIDKKLLLQILEIGLPTGFQSMLTQFSNAFAQSYINCFGSDVMAGWSCFNKLDQIVFLPINSMGQSTTTFVGQNCGAGLWSRVKNGTRISLLLSMGVTAVFSFILFVLARPLTAMFTRDAAVISYGVQFINLTLVFRQFNCVNHILAGTIRGRKDSKGPMVIMIFSFVVVRQIYLYISSGITQNIYVAGMGWPVGWVVSSLLMAVYYYLKYIKSERAEKQFIK